MGRRTVLLVAAILVAAVGTVLVSLYVQGVNTRARAREAPQRVLIAKRIIPAGTSGATAVQDGSLEKTTVPKSALAPGALSDITPVADQVALAPIYPGEQILAEKFGKQGDSSALMIPTAGTMAVSVSLSGPSRVNGFIVPGSDVTVFLTTAGTTRVLLPHAQVIALGTRTLVPSSGQTTTQTQSDVVTFGVTAADAQKLIYAQTAGTLYLTLLTKDSKTPTLPGTSGANVFGP
ncbi:MAG: pilus assembly protein CpaB [Actinomycetota bacterium]|jgi:pilus assembly protein CpaB|nr:pilus assembly protein CpaB [Actinomycetota bacterium]